MGVVEVAATEAVYIAGMPTMVVVGASDIDRPVAGTIAADGGVSDSSAGVDSRTGVCVGDGDGVGVDVGVAVCVTVGAEVGV